jgi:hypothetical protein
VSPQVRALSQGGKGSETFLDCAGVVIDLVLEVAIYVFEGGTLLSRSVQLSLQSSERDERRGGGRAMSRLTEFVSPGHGCGQRKTLECKTGTRETSVEHPFGF